MSSLEDDDACVVDEIITATTAATQTVLESLILSILVIEIGIYVEAAAAAVACWLLLFIIDQFDDEVTRNPFISFFISTHLGWRKESVNSLTLCILCVNDGVCVVTGWLVTGSVIDKDIKDE